MLLFILSTIFFFQVEVQSIGLQRVWHDWVTFTLALTHLFSNLGSFYFFYFFLFFFLNFFFKFFLNFIFFYFFYYFILFYFFLNFKIFNSYMRSQTWTPLPPPSPQHLSGSSPCTSPKHAAPCIRHRLAIQFLHDSIHVRIPILPNHPTLSFSLWVQKSGIHICVFFSCLAYRVVIAIFLNSIYMC